MRPGWRAISGPALTAATALLAVLLDRLLPIPSPAPLLVCIIAFAGSLSGFVSGMVSAGVAVTGTALFFLHRTSGQYVTADLIHLGLLAADGHRHGGADRPDARADARRI